MEETEKKEAAAAEGEVKCCEESKCNCEKVRKFLPQIIAAVILLIVVCGFGYYKLVWKKSHLTESEAKTKMENFINDSILRGRDGMKAEVSSASKENGIFKMTVKIGDQEILSYLTVDGIKFIPRGESCVFDVEETAKNAEAQAAAEEKAAAEAAAIPDPEIPKTVKPKVDLYVMSFCPYGNKAEDTLKSVYALLKNKVDFNFHYIVSSDGNTISSLHGEKEVAQNEREACVLKNYGKDKWMDFVTYVNANCGNDGSCFEEGLKTLGVSVASVNACVASRGVTLMKADEKLSTDAKVSSSPTLMINGVPTKTVIQFGNSEEYKKVICSGFKNEPAECAKTLEAAATTSEGGSCGNQ